MARIAIELPALGFDMESARLSCWLKAIGEQVAPGEPVAEIETEKATVELEAPAGGVLAEVRFQDGDDVPVGEVVGYLDDGS